MTADRRDYGKDYRRNDRPGIWKHSNTLFIYILGNSYHPYRSGRSNGPSSGSRLVSVSDALKTDRILSIENFVNAERIDPEEKGIVSSYFSYVEKHQIAFLKSLFKKEKT